MIRPGDFIVSYANTAHYVKGLQRLHRSLDRPEVGWNKGISLMLTTKLPDRCPPHSDHPYAFKAYMIADAISAGAKRILWADSSQQLCVPCYRLLFLFRVTNANSRTATHATNETPHKKPIASIAMFGIGRLPILNI